MCIYLCMNKWIKSNLTSNPRWKAENSAKYYTREIYLVYSMSVCNINKVIALRLYSIGIQRYNLFCFIESVVQSAINLNWRLDDKRFIIPIVNYMCLMRTNSSLTCAKNILITLIFTYVYIFLTYMQNSIDLDEEIK